MVCYRITLNLRPAITEGVHVYLYIGLHKSIIYVSLLTQIYTYTYLTYPDFVFLELISLLKYSFTKTEQLMHLSMQIPTPPPGLRRGFAGLF